MIAVVELNDIALAVVAVAEPTYLRATLAVIAVVELNNIALAVVAVAKINNIALAVIAVAKISGYSPSCDSSSQRNLRLS